MVGSLKSVTQIENGNLYGNDNEECCICCWNTSINAVDIGKDDVPGTDWPFPVAGSAACYCGCCPCTPGSISFSMTHCETEVLGGPQVPPDRYVAECKDMEGYSFDLELRATECFYSQNLAYEVNPDGINNGTSRICGEVYQGEGLHKLHGEYNTWQDGAEYGEMWGYKGVICADGAGHNESNRAAFQFASNDPAPATSPYEKASCEGMGIVASLCCCKTGQDLGNDNNPPPPELSASKCPAPWRATDPLRTTEPGDGIFITPNCPSTHLAADFGYNSVKEDDYTYPNAVNDVCSIGCYTFALYPDPYRYSGQYWVHGGWDWDAGVADPDGGGWVGNSKITPPGDEPLSQGRYLDTFYSACSPCNWHNIPFMPKHPYRVVTDSHGNQVFPGTSSFTPWEAQLTNAAQTDPNDDTGGTHHPHVGDASAFGEGNMYSTPSAHTRLVSGNCYTSDSEFVLMVEGGFKFSYGCDCATGWLPCYYNEGIAAQTSPNVCFTCGIMQPGGAAAKSHGAVDGCVGPKTEGEAGQITAPFDYGCEDGDADPLTHYCEFTIPCGDYAPTGRFANFHGVNNGVVGANFNCNICIGQSDNAVFEKYSDIFMNNQYTWNLNETARNILLAAAGVTNHEDLCSPLVISTYTKDPDHTEKNPLPDIEYVHRVSAYGGCAGGIWGGAGWYEADGSDIQIDAEGKPALGSDHGGYPHGCCPEYFPPLTETGPGCMGPDCAPSQIYQCGICTNCGGEAEGRRAVTIGGECAHGFMRAKGDSICWPSGEHMEGTIFVRWSGVLTS